MKSTIHAIMAGSCLACTWALSGCGADVERSAPSASDQPVIGGTEALLGEWPWQVQINEGGSHYCGGSLLSESWVLTAAHCVEGVDPADLELRAGLVDRASPGPQVQVSGAANVHIHPSHNIPSTFDNDVALIELDSPMSFDRYVQPIAVRSSVAPVGATAYVTGWGWTQGGGLASSNSLMEAPLPIVSTATCNAGGTLSQTVTDTMVCAGHLTGEQGGCHGDSGGPLVMPSAGFSNGWELVGVVSWGVGFSCDSYTVFARLSELSAWIDGIVGETPVMGDVDGSGCVDNADHDAVIADFGQSVPPGDPAADLNSDGVINIQDRLIVLQNYGEGC